MRKVGDRRGTISPSSSGDSLYGVAFGGLTGGDISVLKSGRACGLLESSFLHSSEQYRVDVLGTILSQTAQYCWNDKPKVSSSSGGASSLLFFRECPCETLCAFVGVRRRWSCGLLFRRCRLVRDLLVVVVVPGMTGRWQNRDTASCV